MQVRAKLLEEHFDGLRRWKVGEVLTLTSATQFSPYYMQLQGPWPAEWGKEPVVDQHVLANRLVAKEAAWAAGRGAAERAERARASIGQKGRG